MKVSASVPTRTDLADGTVDVYPLCLFEYGGLTVNAAINVRGHVTVEERADARTHTRSEDTSAGQAFADLDEMQKRTGGGLSIQRYVREFTERFAQEVLTRVTRPQGEAR